MTLQSKFKKLNTTSPFKYQISKKAFKDLNNRTNFTKT